MQISLWDRPGHAWWDQRAWMDKLGEWFVPEPNTGCWLWTRCVDRDGYGIQNVEHRRRFAHRVSYEILRGPIGFGLTIDHLCRNRCCVNPDHLEPVPFAVNRARGVWGDARAKGTHWRSHCQRGHELSAENLEQSELPKRKCKLCRRLRDRVEYRRRKSSG